MKIVRKASLPHADYTGGALTIGNFDGVHEGHQQVLAELIGHAVAVHGPSIVVTFDPHPRKVLFPQESPRRLCHLHERLAYTAACGVDALFLLHFDHELAALQPQQFIEMLYKRFAFRHIHIGYDFAFGNQRSGDVEQLRMLGDELGFMVTEAGAFEKCGAIVSSSRIRSAIEAADLELAATLLGRRFSISGHVGRGDQRGRALGFPTANLDLRDLVHPPAGIYAVRADSGGEVWDGVAYLGFRPTFSGRTLVLETHIFDAHPDLYKKRLRVEFGGRVREDRAYRTGAALSRQIEKDCAAARMLLQRAATVNGSL
ncbi:MAG: riboflavin biosynthesis protein RibF [Mariprofundales bacterium]|nr:riboflavin biosynthesis protein RibF [Mariprofundales bacterium]